MGFEDHRPQEVRCDAQAGYPCLGFFLDVLPQGIPLIAQRPHIGALVERYTVLAAVLEKLAHGERFGFHGVPLMVCAFWPVRTMASLGRGDCRVLRVI
ncbi:hypothetical protein D3C78_1461580 [compost metagenome]